ncbi:glycosyltransferase family 4 protein [Algibacter mikhailovii]|uniref:Glycosyl transferase family 1 domain-containing protein n=1 Tax=Algibacter mikhailovii TaxID=425498 RepID=A0A918R1W6_9FLAO|nr:glycosyltransferase family 4 protein [Algibacter mikhailovii]GGZ80992.1 hypothetical protein GCM10007028_18010 [Algibacter mikhailovii]
MKIALVLSSTPAYSETFFRSKIRGLQISGHQVLLITAKKDVNFDLCEQYVHPKVYKNKVLQLIMMIKVYLGLSFYIKNVLNYFKSEREEHTPFKRILEKIYINASLLKLNVDWLHFGFATMTKDRELVAQAIGAKMGVSFRGFDINVYPLKNADCYTKLWKHVDAVHSISIDLWQKACGLGLLKTTPYQIIAPAVDKSITAKEAKVEQGNAPVEIITIGRLHYIKGIDLLIETAKRLKDYGLVFKWRIVGGGDSSDFERYRYHIYQSGLKNIVVLEGKKIHEDSLILLEQANLYVQTSYDEGFCNALLEAQGKGKICIAFNVGGIPENIIHGNTGFLVDKVSSDALMSQIIKTIALPLQEKKTISKNAVNRVKREFTLENQQQAFLNFYNAFI